MVDVVYETGTLQKGRVHPVVRYTTAQGSEVTGRTDKHHKVKPGDRVQVVYDPAKPEVVDVGTLEQARRQRWFFSGLAVALGIALAGGAVALERRNR